MRDRLIKLIKDSLNKHIGKSCLLAENIVDDLLEHGVIVPPCKVGDKVYVIKRCRCGRPENYVLQVCGKRVVAKSPKVLARVMTQEKSKNLRQNLIGMIECGEIPKVTICYNLYEKPFTLKMLTEIGKTVFLTREEAEQALKDGAE